MADKTIPNAMIDAAIAELREVIDPAVAEHHYDVLVDCVRAAILAAAQAAWRPIEECPVNVSVEIWLPDFEHYGPGIYRAILVDNGTGRRWHTTAWACGRDLDPMYWPKLFRLLPASPVSCVPKAKETGESEG